MNVAKSVFVMHMIVKSCLGREIMGSHHRFGVMLPAHLRAESKKQRAAIKRRFEAVEVTSSLARLGRPMMPVEKRVRREAGRNGPQGPGELNPSGWLRSSKLT